MAKHVYGSTRMISKTFTINGQQKRIKVPVYDTFDAAVRELGELRVLKDVNSMNIQRARWMLASRSKARTA